MTCDYCPKQDIVKVTTFNHYWNLCYDCAVKNSERLSIDIDKLNQIRDELKGSDTDGKL